MSGVSSVGSPGGWVTVIGGPTPRRSMRIGSSVAAVLCLVILIACGGEGDGHSEMERGVDRSQATQADSLFASEMFDTITWPSDSVRLLRGNEVYAAECRRCHGYLGRGGTEYADARDLVVPSLVRPDWEYARDLRGALRQIFTGHGEGMPSWGIGRLTPRQIQAATYYVLYQLRPEVLGDSARTGS